MHRTRPARLLAVPALLAALSGCGTALGDASPVEATPNGAPVAVPAASPGRDAFLAQVRTLVYGTKHFTHESDVALLVTGKAVCDGLTVLPYDQVVSGLERGTGRPSAQQADQLIALTARDLCPSQVGRIPPGH